MQFGAARTKASSCNALRRGPIFGTYKAALYAMSYFQVASATGPQTGIHVAVGVKSHSYFAFARSAKSEVHLLCARRSFNFYRDSQEARQQFEHEPTCAPGEYYEVGWGVLTLNHGMTEWRDVQLAELRRGIK